MGTIKTGAGSLQGAEVTDPGTGRLVHRYAGIPFAQPPVDGRRFQLPGPAPTWDGSRPAASFGPSAPQLSDGPFADLVPGMKVGETSEDCLTLNIWTPADASASAGLPVLVWIHGGAFTIGGSSLETYDGTRLAAAHDVVVVSVNYRIGALGFLTLPVDTASRIGATPNAGLLDLVAALGWVGEHIGAFGGDAANVTVFGESAGAGAIEHLLVMPAAKGLFRRAILQSPGAMTIDRAGAEQLSAAFLRTLGVPVDEPGRLLDVPVSEILRAQTDAANELMPVLGAMPWHPVVDGDVIPQAAIDGIRSGRADGVDVIIGTTSEEMRLFADAGMAELTPDSLPVMLQMVAAPQLHGDPGADAAAAFVAAVLGDRTTGDLFTILLTETMMRVPALQVTEALAERNGSAATYSYSFEWPAPTVGSCHGIDLPFTFGTLDCCGWDTFCGADADAEQLSATVMASWAAFARTGDPSSSETGNWPAYRSPERTTMQLAPTTATVENPVARLLPAYRALQDAAARA
jgi:para-nitrobenzyl esterase